jgi:hypothetical protein
MANGDMKSKPQARTIMSKAGIILSMRCTCSVEMTKYPKRNNATKTISINSVATKIPVGPKGKGKLRFYSQGFAVDNLLPW